jgi:ferric-dicitrate binding protein FerR (iron transport regulator)
MKYAAVALLVLLSALSAYLFMDNREMSALTANQVVVKTAEGERTTVTLPDGTTVRLNSKSQLDYKQDFGLKDRQVSFNGEGFFDVAHNVEKTFVVNTHFINVQVLGTKFNLYTYENKDQIEMALVKGHVKVTTNQQPYQTADVQPNQKIVFEKKTGRMQIVDTDNQLETAWMSHDLVFHAEPLQTVLDCIGRKFGVTIKTDKLFNLNDTYTGMFDETNIREIMQILSIHYGFDYQLKGNIVYVNRPK